MLIKIVGGGPRPLRWPAKPQDFSPMIEGVAFEPLAVEGVGKQSELASES